MLSFALLLLSAGLQEGHAATLLTQSFGGTQSAGCSAHWTGDCESSVSPFGASGALSAAYDGGGADGVLVAGAAGTFPNGFGVAYSGTIPTLAEFIVQGVVLADGTEVGLRMVFRDGSGAAISSVATNQTLDEGVFKLHLSASTPASMASVDLEVGMKGAGTSVWVNSMELEDDPPTTALDCAEEASACESESCASVCGQVWCDSCANYAKLWGCTGRVDGEDCILMPACYCDFPNSVTLTSH